MSNLVMMVKNLVGGYNKTIPKNVIESIFTLLKSRADRGTHLWLNLTHALGSLLLRSAHGDVLLHFPICLSTHNLYRILPTQACCKPTMVPAMNIYSTVVIAGPLGPVYSPPPPIQHRHYHYHCLPNPLPWMSSTHSKPIEINSW